MMGLEFADRIACPDCGSLAQRIGHHFVDHAAGQEVRGFQQDCVYISRDRNHQPFKPGTPGVVILESEKSEVRFGAQVKSSEARAVLAITHWCTNPDCSVVFAECAGTPWRGDE